MTDPTPPTPPRPDRKVGPYEASLVQTRSRRKAVQARAASQRRRKVVVAGLASVLLAGAATGGVVWWTGHPAEPEATAGGLGGKKCSDTTPVSLWVSDAVQPAALALAKSFQSDPSTPCVDFRVRSQTPIAAMIGLGKGQQNRPDGWISDSPRWVERVNATAQLNIKTSQPFAKSPLVIAMDPKRAKDLDGQPQWLELVGSDTPIRLSDPRSTTAGMLTLSSALPLLSPEQGRLVIPKLAKSMAASVEELFSAYNGNPEDAAAFPVSEADLIDHNRTYPTHKMVSVTPSEGTPAFEFSLVNVATDPAKAQAIEQLRAFLLTPEAAQILAQYGLRSTSVPVTMPTPEGSIGEVKVGTTPNAEQVATATDVWQSATTDFSLLAVFDVSGSMNNKVGNSTRVAVTTEAAGIALKALPKTTRLAWWIFSTNKGPGGADYREVVPFGQLDDDLHRAKIAQAAASLASQVGGNTGLYDTIWAAYQQAQENYDPQRVNAVVLLTDGRNDDGRGLSFEQLKAKLRAANDPKRPIAVTTIGIGPDVDSKALTEISTMTYSNFYAAPSPADMTSVLARALFDHECKSGRCV